MNQRIPLCVAAILVALTLGAAPDEPGAAQPKPKVVEVTIEDTQFKPDEITIKVGQTVRWTNKDNRDHIIMAKDQSFKSENLKHGEKFEHKFTEAGTVDYICVYRPRMLGQVKVEE